MRILTATTRRPLFAALIIAAIALVVSGMPGFEG